MSCLSMGDNEISLTAGQKMMRHNLHSFVENDFLSGAERAAKRSAFMYDNFTYWANSFENMPKTIVWSSSTHAAKSSEISSLFINTPQFWRSSKGRIW